MTGRLPASFRLGNLAEHLGLLLLKGVAAVAEVAVGLFFWLAISFVPFLIGGLFFVVAAAVALNQGFTDPDDAAQLG